MNFANNKQQPTNLPLSSVITSFLKLEPINCILEASKGRGGLYLGNIFAAFSEDTLNQFQIGAVLTVAAHTDLKITTRTHKIVEADDIPTQDLFQYFEEMLGFIEENIKLGKNVFVHCFAGVSRSDTTIIAYLMKYKNMDYKSAYNLCKKQRTVTCPNPGFTRQLREFDKLLRNSD